MDFLKRSQSPYFLLPQAGKYGLFKLAARQIYWTKNGSMTYKYFSANFMDTVVKLNFLKEDFHTYFTEVQLGYS